MGRVRSEQPVRAGEWVSLSAALGEL